MENKHENQCVGRESLENSIVPLMLKIKDGWRIVGTKFNSARIKENSIFILGTYQCAFVLLFLWDISKQGQLHRHTSGRVFRHRLCIYKSCIHQWFKASLRNTHFTSMCIRVSMDILVSICVSMYVQCQRRASHSLGEGAKPLVVLS